MFGTGSAPPSRHNLTLTGDIARQDGNIFIVDFHIPFAKGTDCWLGDEVPRTSYSSSINQIFFSFILFKG